jgi:GNAT superfamily N-acetyltransferase
VTDEDAGSVVAFYASSTGAVLRSKAPGRLSRNQPEELPVILLGRMAVDLKHAGRGLGAAMLRHFMLKAVGVAERAGVRLVLVHAKDEQARGYYLHHGFVESPVDPLTLMMLLPVNRA